MGNPITSSVEELIRTKRLSHISWRGNEEFEIEHASSIPERFRSYKIIRKYKLLWSMHYYHNETDLLVNSCQEDRSLDIITMLSLRIPRWTTKRINSRAIVHIVVRKRHKDIYFEQNLFFIDACVVIFMYLFIIIFASQCE